MDAKKAWHDTVIHKTDHGSDCGPIVPTYPDPPDTAEKVAEVRCCNCGATWLETDQVRLARIWWSAGAWRGHEEPPCVPRSQGPGTATLFLDNVEESRDLLRRAAAIVEEKATAWSMEDRWDAEDTVRECRAHADLLDQCMEDHP